MANGKLLWNTGSSAPGSVMTEKGGDGEWGGRQTQEGRGVCTHKVDSFHCIAEINTTP